MTKGYLPPTLRDHQFSLTGQNNLIKTRLLDLYFSLYGTFNCIYITVFFLSSFAATMMSLER